MTYLVGLLIIGVVVFAIGMMAARRERRESRDSPEVAAFRKLLRGERLTAAERALLAGTRKPDPATRTVPHAAIEAELEERRRREGE